MRLVREVYRLTETFPESEKFGLTGQMRRAAVSIPSNIAEGAARGGPLELARFLCIARGSLAELDTQIWIALDLNYLADAGETQHSIQLLMAQINALISTKRKRNT